MKKIFMATVFAVMLLPALAGTSKAMICIEYTGKGYGHIFAFRNLGNGFYSVNGRYRYHATANLSWTGTIRAAGGFAAIGITGTDPNGTNGNYLDAETFSINLSTDTGTASYQYFYTASGDGYGYGSTGHPVTLIRGCNVSEKEGGAGPKPFSP